MQEFGKYIFKEFYYGKVSTMIQDCKYSYRLTKGVCLRVSLAATKPHNQKVSWGGKGFCLTFISSKDIRTGAQAGQGSAVKN